MRCRIPALLAMLAMLALAGCPRVISPYDKVIDDGIQTYKLDLNLLIAEAGNNAGTPEGAYNAFKKRYTELGVRLDLLADRARVDEADDIDCSIDEKLAEKIKTKFSDALAALPSGGAKPAAGKGCMELLIDNARKQLAAVEQIHSNAGMSQWPSDPALTCIRPAAAKGARDASNRSLDAALLVQTAKRKGEAK